MNTKFPSDEIIGGHCNFYVIDDINSADPENDLFFKETSRKERSLYDNPYNAETDSDDSDEYKGPSQKKSKLDKEQWTNLSERSRRRKMLRLFQKLKNLLPYSRDGYCETPYEKLAVLQNACGYVKQTKRIKLSLDICTLKNKKLEKEIAELKIENEKMKNEITNLKLEELNKLKSLDEPASD